MATYDNDLRLKEITTGDEDGTWGDSTNTNLELIADGFSYGTKEMAADANETFTMPDFSADATRSLYLKITSAVSLTATREVTLGPNTVSKTWIIENATSGSQIITIKQGSGATVNVPNGSKVMVVTDGAGAGAAVFNANPTEVGGTVTSIDVSGGTTGLTTSGGPVTTSGTITLAGTLAVANGGTGVTSSTGTGSVVLSNSPTFTGTVTIPTADINGGTIDGTVIGGSTAAAGTFTTGQFNTSLNVDGTATMDGLTVNTSGTSAAFDPIKIYGNGGSGAVQGAAGVGFWPINGGTNPAAQIISLENGNGTYAGFIDFQTREANTDTTPVQRMRIAHNGDISFYEDTGVTPKFFWDASAERLGIGNSSPSDAYVTAPNLVLGNTSDTFSGITLFTSSAGSQRILFADGTSGTDNRVGQVVYDHSNNSMAFTTNATERLRIDSSGNVGIGTSSPDYKLEVEEAGTGSGLGGIAAATATAGGNAGYRWVTGGTARFAMATVGSAGLEGLRIYDNNNTAERLRIDSSGNVGIGTSSPAAKVHLKDETATAVQLLQLESGWNNPSGNKSIEWTDATNTLGRISVDYTAPKASMRFGSLYNSGYQTGDVMTLTGDGNVGIGTSSPTQKLHITDSAPFARLESTSTSYNGFTTKNDSGNFYFGIDDSGGTFYGSAYARAIYADGAYPVTFYTNAAERMRITSSGNVGIGTSSPATLLDIQGVGGGATSPIVTATTGTNYIGWKSTNTGGSFWTAIDNSTGSSFSTGTAYARVLWSNGAYPMVFSTNSTERMRIDASGNLLVGKTVTGFGTAGIELHSNDQVFATSTTHGLAVNRLSTDGDIAKFYKNGTTVGSIGVFSNSLSLCGAASGLYFNGAALNPTTDNPTVRTDGVMDIGQTSQRFKDLYLSGGVYLGGTVAANKLDDYEEGTWTPAYNTSGGGTITTVSNAGHYVKIGDFVFCSWRIRSSAVSGISGNIAITGFPFTSGADVRTGGSVGYIRSWNSDMPEFRLYKEPGNTQMTLWKNATNAAASAVTTSDFSTGSDNNVLEGSVVYKV
jgi:hypothetical protein